jgi:PAS domain S-box-containing protein
MLPLVMGWLRALSDANQLLDVSVARPLSITIMITTYGAAIWWNARTVTQVDDDRARLDEERLAAEREVRASEARFRRVSECGMIGIVFGNIHGNIYDANDAFLKVIGATRDEVRAGKLRWADLTAPEQRRLDEKAIVEMQHCGVAVPYEKEYIRADGVRVPVLIGVAFLEGSRTDTVAFVLDLSYRRQMEEMSQQQQQAIAHLARVTTVGEMAAGLAHELNQPLGAILNNASAAIDAVSGEEQMIAGINDALEDIASEARRAGEIIRRVRNFVRKQRPRFAAAQVNGMIREAVGLMAADLRRSGVRLDLKLADNLPEAMADNVQIEQVLVNVLRNALDAMASIKPSERRLVIHSDAPDRLSVRVRITDSGCGATAESCNDMFNAFFTTKAEGMGMGLAISRSIIVAHGGHIQAKANPGRGITMEFSLPVAAACEALA